MQRIALPALRLAALACVAGFALLADNVTGQWFLDLPESPNQPMEFGIHRPHHQSSFSVHPEEFRGLSPSATHFEFLRDAGVFVCDGRFEGRHGAGTFVFRPNAEYTAEMRRMGYSIPEDRLIDLAYSTFRAPTSAS